MQGDYPSYDDLMKEDEDVQVRPVDQSEIKVVNINGGICGGLSVRHITSNLTSDDFTPKNPFDNDDEIRKSAQIAHDCDDMAKCFDEFLKKDSNLTTGPLESINNKSLLDELNKTIQKTIEDKKARGVYIGGDCSRSAKFGTPLSGGHAVSLTVKNHDGELSCTALNSNMFFAQGSGVSGCKKAAQKLDDLTKAYAQSNMRIIKTSSNRPGS